jgi:amidohydrolase
MQPLRDCVASALPQAVETRHDLHTHPELQYKETRTCGVVQARLQELGIQFKGGLAGGTGVLGWLPSTVDPASARTVALRADMDALPILENTGLPYKSVNEGVMHACGHDGHTTILMTTAGVLQRLPERPNNVLLIFQPAEEGGAGGQKLCKEGALRGEVIGKPADVIFGLHGYPGAEVGHVTTRNGALLAAASQFNIHILGKGSHAAYPHYGIDPIVVAAHIVTALQTVASRSVNPLDSLVITIGQIVAGVAHNVIPDRATLRGTLRALNDTTEQLGIRKIEEISANISAALGASATVEWTGAYPVTFNHTEPTDEFRSVARRVLGESLVHEEPHPSMGGEDFSFYGKEIPASFFFLGLRPSDRDTYPNLHSPEFDFNDNAIPVGVELMCELALSH